MRRRSTRWLGATAATLAVIAVVSACGTSDPSDSSKASQRSPNALRVRISCFCKFGIIHIESANKRLVYASTRTRRAIRLNPPRTQWGRFWRRVNELDVWDWEKRYELDPEITDQLRWSVDLEHGGKEIHTSGYGGWPTEFGEFQAALSSLVGNRPVLQVE